MQSNHKNAHCKRNKTLQNQIELKTTRAYSRLLTKKSKHDHGNHI